MTGPFAAAPPAAWATAIAALAVAVVGLRIRALVGVDPLIDGITGGIAIALLAISVTLVVRHHADRARRDGGRP